MKKRIFVFAAMLLVILAAVCFLGNRGDVSNVQRIIGKSSVYTETEIDQAMDVAAAYFRDNFEGCKLLTLEYDDKWRADALYRANQYGVGPNQVIIIQSSFYVPAKGADSSLNPDDTYTHWKWILTRTEGGKWSHKDHGYG